MIAWRLAAILLVGFAGGAVPAPAQAQTFKSFAATPAGSFTVPTGRTPASAAETQAKALVVKPPRLPIPPEEYERLKRDAGTLAPIAPDVPPIPRRGATASGQSLTVQRICRTNPQVPSGPTPPDIHGAVGPTTLVVVTNFSIGIYDKATCQELSFLPLSSFFAGSVLPGETLFDPRVLFDARTQRFLLVVETRMTDPNDPRQSLFYSVSKDASGTTWSSYKQDLQTCKRAPNNFLDYPNIGVNANSWVVALADFAADGKSATSTIISISKQGTLAGAGTQLRCYPVPDFNVAPAIVLDNDPTMTLLSPGFGSGNKLTRWLLDSPVDFARETLSPGPPITILPWTAPPPALQPNGQALDSGDGRFVSSSVQIGGSVVNVHTIAYRRASGPVRARLRLYGIARGANTAQITVSPAILIEDDVFMASVAFTQQGLAIAATRTNSTLTTGSTGFASSVVFYAALAGLADPGSWTFDIVGISDAQMIDAGVDNTGKPITCNETPGRLACRWGDYSSVQVDPSNPTSVWTFGEVVTGPSNFQWGTVGGLSGLGEAAAGAAPAPAPAPAPEASAAPAPAPTADATKKKGTLTPEEMTDVLRAD